MDNPIYMPPSKYYTTTSKVTKEMMRMADNRAIFSNFITLTIDAINNNFAIHLKLHFAKTHLLYALEG